MWFFTFIWSVYSTVYLLIFARKIMRTVVLSIIILRLEKLHRHLQPAAFHFDVNNFCTFLLLIVLFYFRFNFNLMWHIIIVIVIAIAIVITITTQIIITAEMERARERKKKSGMFAIQFSLKYSYFEFKYSCRRCHDKLEYLILTLSLGIGRQWKT